LPRKRQHALQHGNADWQIAVQVKKGRQRLGWLDGDEFGDKQSVCGPQAIEAKRYTFGSIPHVEGNRLRDDRGNENGDPNKHDCEHREPTIHGAILCR
jgi:hypothetical protein